MKINMLMRCAPTAVWGFHVGFLFRSTLIIIIIIIWHLASLRISPVTWDHYFRRLSGDPTLEIFHDLISHPPNRIFWDTPPLPSGGKIEKWTFNVLNFQEEARLKQLQELEAQKEDDDYKNTPEGKLEEKLR